MPIIPTITTSYYDGKESKDIYSLLLEQRIIMISDEITDQLSSLIVSEIIYLNAQDQSEPITIYINSPGGSIYAGLAIYDIMKKVEAPIITIGLGLCASMGAFLLSAGSKGKRYALENAEIMIHQPLGGSQGQVSDIEIMTKRYLYLRNKLNAMLAKHTGQRIKKIAKDTDRDYFMSSEEAKEYGLIDEVISLNSLK
ncbi:MAG: ATP-dependent Clp protease proteolytic subunit [Erysipelotrichaceae bacterium]|nr:ATP-dependent Clp protease proteolytic subunit [Erysipelotrichaceae bacterium]